MLAWDYTGNMQQMFPFRLTVFSRPVFIEAVETLLDPDIILLNKRCTSVEIFESHSVVHFADGSSYSADLVLGADGIKSTVRNVVTGDQQPRTVFMNTVAYRGLVHTDDLVKDGVQLDYTERPVCFVGMDKVRNTCTMKQYLIFLVAHHHVPHKIRKNHQRGCFRCSAWCSEGLSDNSS